MVLDLNLSLFLSEIPFFTKLFVKKLGHPTFEGLVKTFMEINAVKITQAEYIPGFSVIFCFLILVKIFICQYLVVY